MFTNEKIINAERKMSKEILISVFIIVAAFISFYVSFLFDEKDKKNEKDLKTIIQDKSITAKDELYSKINIKRNLFKFAVYDDTTDAYYFTTDGEYLYIMYMTIDKYKEIYNEEKKDDFIKVEGITALVSKDVKELAIDTYNEMFELSDEEKLTIADFENYFGTVYLDTTKDLSGGGLIFFIIGFGALIFGIILFIITIVRKINYKSGIKKLDSNIISKLEQEMNDEEAFYYDNSCVCLTKNYIINFGMKFSYIDYKDVIWIYEFNSRVYGIKTIKSIMVVDKYGKQNRIALNDAFTKKSKMEYEEIINTLTDKCNNALIGYTRDNIKNSKEIIKKNKELGIK